MPPATPVPTSPAAAPTPLLPTANTAEDTRVLDLPLDAIDPGPENPQSSLRAYTLEAL
jgi:hypothetical protein